MMRNWNYELTEIVMRHKKTDIRILCSIITGQAPTPYMLSKIRKKEGACNLCGADDRGNLEHFLFDCISEKVAKLRRELGIVREPVDKFNIKKLLSLAKNTEIIQYIMGTQKESLR